MKMHELVARKRATKRTSPAYKRLQAAIDARAALLGADFHNLRQAQAHFDTVLAELYQHHPEMRP